MPEAPASAAELELPPTLPILVLRSAVLFPHGVIGLQVATDRSLRLVESLTPGESGASAQVVIFSARSGESEPTKLEDFAQVGVVAEVVQVLKLGQDRQQLFLHGLQRVGLSAIEQTDPFFVGRLKRLKPPRPAPAVEVEVLLSRALETFEILAGADDRYSRETVELLRMNLDQGVDIFSDLLATYLNVAVEEKQRLVETVHAAERLQLLVELIDQELARVAVDRDIQSRVRTEIEKQQFTSDKGSFQVTLSLGIAADPDDGSEKHRLIEHAVQALYFAKRNGRNRAVCFVDLGAEKQKRRTALGVADSSAA